MCPARLDPGVYQLSEETPMKTVNHSHQYIWMNNKHTLISSQLLWVYSKVCFYCFFMVICRSGVTRLNTLRFHKTQCVTETLMFCGSWWAVSKNDGWLIPTRLNAHERKMFIESYKWSDEKGKRSIQSITKTSTPKWFTSFLD